MQVAPHPLLVPEILDGQPLRFVIVTAPPETQPADLCAALRERPFVPMHVTGRGGRIVYGMTSQRMASELMHMRFDVDFLGDPGLPGRADLFLFRDDLAETTGLLSPEGEAGRFFSEPQSADLLLAARTEGLVVALPAGRSPGEFHFARAKHGHTIKFVGDPSLLDAAPVPSAGASATGFAAPQTAIARSEPTSISVSRIADCVARYSGAEPLDATDPVLVRSRHIAATDDANARVVRALAREFAAIGQGGLAVRLIQFTHRGLVLHNVEAELPGSTPDLVLVTAHLDSTAGNDPGYDEINSPAPGADDDASGVAAVFEIARYMTGLAAATRPVRTIRFVLFNAEEEGLIGSRVYARQQRAEGRTIAGVYQLDMIGYNKRPPAAWEIHAGFSTSPSTEARSLQLANRLRDMALQVSPALHPAQIYHSASATGDPAAGRSDHASFQAYGYPACLASEDFFADGAPDAPDPDGNPHYHHAGDAAGEIDPRYAADIARAIAGAAWLLAMQPTASESRPPLSASFADPAWARGRGDPEIGQSAAGQEFDIAIVGGGVAGIYAAWCLREARGDLLGPRLRELAAGRPDGRLRVGLFEYTERIGGRLFSLHMPGVPEVAVELGGMRFLNLHRRVVGLVKRFGFETRELRVEDCRDRHMFYLRGQHFAGADWKRPSFTPPYRLERGERAQSPGGLLAAVALRHEALVRQDPERYRNYGFWNLLLDELSDQAYRLVRDAGGYETLVNNWNAAEAIPFLLADFPQGAQYLALRHGFEQLPLKLKELFEQAGGEIFTGHRLHRLDRGEDGSISLTLDRGDPAKFGMGRRLQQAVPVRARHVVLAVGRRALEMLHPDSFVFDCPRFECAARAVLPQPGFKIFAAYRRPWWKKERGMTAGRSVTDLPVRQCYYWHTSPSDGNSVLMASYNDGASTEFWAGLIRQTERYKPPPHACPPGVPLPDDLRGSVAPAALVAELQDQLREMHGLGNVTSREGAQIVAPYYAVFRDWSQEPFGGGWHFWKIGENAEQVSRYMQKPFDNVPLYLCGEAWSRQQGWVEGALETADGVLERQLLLPRHPDL
ncbi:MAG: M28 family peptidase [Alphaproteobacteria bacterium]